MELLKEFIEIHHEIKFFDLRENKGCTTEELSKLEGMIHPDATIPRILQEYLKYCGKWYWNSGQTYNELLRSRQFPYWREFLHNRGFWVTEYNEESSVICGFKISELHKDDPPYYTSETLEVTDLYQLFPSYLSEERIEQVLNRAIKTDEYFTCNPKIYAVKKAIVELYSLFEHQYSMELSPISDKLRRLASSSYFAANVKSTKDSFLTECQHTIFRINSFHKAAKRHHENIKELSQYIEDFKNSSEGER